MSEEDNKDKIEGQKEEENKVDENQLESESNSPDNQNSDNSDKINENVNEIQSKDETSPEENQKPELFNEQSAEKTENVEEKKEHEVIHKKDGRLHIYIRQDKYKGELKSKNWVGRLYIDGKQKIFSSGTPNLEEAIPILEKWFDDIHANKDNEQQSSTETTSQQTPGTETTSQQPPETETTSQQPPETVAIEKTTEPVVETPKQQEPAAVSQSVSAPEEKKESPVTKTSSRFLEKFKNIKLKKPSFGKKDLASKIPSLGKGSFSKKLQNLFNSKIGKSAVKGEEIVGVEITNKEIRLAQVSSNKSNQWILDKFFVHPVDLPEDASVLDNAEKLGGELTVALQKSKIKTANAAIAIPVTSAIIRVVTSPLMKDEELQKAIETNSLWENLVQLTDNLDDYSIFHQVINRSEKENTMDILFVASKLADINNYTSIIKQSNLNPVIIDVKCFALKSAVDQINQISRKSEDANLTAVLEFGLDENYLMILYDNNPIITDIFLRSQDRKILLDSQDQEEKEALVRRFITQVKQAVQDFETKYEKRIRNIKVVSDLKNVENFISSFRKNMVNVGFNLFDPIEGLQIPEQVQQSTNIENKSYFSTVIGLAFRKLDVFGYYKFVTAVKNINLLPDRKGMIKEKKIKAFSNFAFKGLVGGVVAIYLILFALSFWNIHSYNVKLTEYDKVLKTYKNKAAETKKISKQLGVMTKTLKLSKSLRSNKSHSYRVLAQVAMSVPKRVKFLSVDYNGSNRIVIKGQAATDQDILKLIKNLSKQKLVQQASLGSMNYKGKVSSEGQTKKNFLVNVKVRR